MLNVELAQQGEAIQQRRRAYLAALSPLACANYEELSRGAETLSLRYAAQFEPGGLAQLLRQKSAPKSCGPGRVSAALTGKIWTFFWMVSLQKCMRVRDSSGASCSA
mgnify:CR=1 FL=1